MRLFQVVELTFKRFSCRLASVKKATEDEVMLSAISQQSASPFPLAMPSEQRVDGTGSSIFPASSWGPPHLVVIPRKEGESLGISIIGIRK
jgi:hypothetical protein